MNNDFSSFSRTSRINSPGTKWCARASCVLNVALLYLLFASREYFLVEESRATLVRGGGGGGGGGSSSGGSGSSSSRINIISNGDDRAASGALPQRQSGLSGEAARPYAPAAAPRCTHWLFVNYTASEYERGWIATMASWIDDPCRKLSAPDVLESGMLLIARVQYFTRNDASYMDALPAAVRARRLGGEPRSAAAAATDDYLFSKMVYRRECSDSAGGAVTTQYVQRLIEPLQGINRDPLTICQNLGALPPRFGAYPRYESMKQSKRFALLAQTAPWRWLEAGAGGGGGESALRAVSAWHYPLVDAQQAAAGAAAAAAAAGQQSTAAAAASPLHEPGTYMSQRCGRRRYVAGAGSDEGEERAASAGRRRCRRAAGCAVAGAQCILIDLGAGLFDVYRSSRAPDKVSTAWFVSVGERVDAKWDRILAIEAEPIAAADVLNAVHADYMGAYTFLNAYASANVTDKMHPWRLLSLIVQPEDFVSIKLDIDHSAEENALTAQLMANVYRTHDIVDEFFYEHHVVTKPMIPYWGTSKELVYYNGRNLYMNDTYHIFSTLRQSGIFAHSWP